jgi:hypothetical protein
MRTILGVTGLLLACSTAPAPRYLLRSGAFHYVARSPAGEPLLTGRLQLSFPDDSTIRGAWAIGWLPGGDTTAQVGPQVGTGDLIGVRSGDSVIIQLNPRNADHNVGLVAVAAAAGYAGKWEWVSFTGPRTAGTFTAILE